MCGGSLFLALIQRSFHVNKLELALLYDTYSNFANVCRTPLPLAITDPLRHGALCFCRTDGTVVSYLRQTKHQKY
jgi:hypothetical protein